MKGWIFFFAITLFLAACEEPVYSPKPRGFPRIEYPDRAGTSSLNQNGCPFSFQLPTYYQIVQDSFFFEEEPLHPCWFDLWIPNFDSRLHCSYFAVGQPESFDELRAKAFDLANWHNKKANYIDEIPIRNAHGAEGMLFAFEGPVASHVQFFLTDSLKQHFFRAALYFNTQSRPDSLAPVYEFLKQDVDMIISSFKWE